eukprot:gnl/Carplike_NY0171/4694_a6377_264.p1 GENE.gnl/Carplike_NY0171/4694_a6377_264~~gnl/Carplike_NY0171/4694_a6377_264.p1  ORF type:complete len:262 (+),score=76.78 gnl/Carplike_NY0171/4694_a6377_264:40-786(+)
MDDNGKEFSIPAGFHIFLSSDGYNETHGLASILSSLFIHIDLSVCYSDLPSIVRTNLAISLYPEAMERKGRARVDHESCVRQNSMFEDRIKDVILTVEDEMELIESDPIHRTIEAALKSLEMGSERVKETKNIFDKSLQFPYGIDEIADKACDIFCLLSGYRDNTINHLPSDLEGSTQPSSEPADKASAAQSPSLDGTAPPPNHTFDESEKKKASPVKNTIEKQGEEEEEEEPLGVNTVRDFDPITSP